MMSDTERKDDGQLQLLIETVESIRKTDFPDLPEELVRCVLMHHADPTSSETEMIRNIEQIVNEHLSNGASS